MENLVNQVDQLFEDLLNKFSETAKAGDLLVLGCSSSEVQGKHIGKASSQEVGEIIVSRLLNKVNELDMQLCVQCCEHLNRALVIEREEANKRGYEIVNAVPQLHAGGSASIAAMKYFIDPVLVEHVVAEYGIDIGDTSIGMHVKHVQVPVRPENKELGQAHVTALRSRPKYIGGSRAKYE